MLLPRLGNFRSMWANTSGLDKTPDPFGKIKEEEKMRFFTSKTNEELLALVIELQTKISEAETRNAKDLTLCETALIELRRRGYKAIDLCKLSDKPTAKPKPEPKLANKPAFDITHKVSRLRRPHPR